MPRTYTVELPLEFMGFEFFAEVEYEVTSWGCPAQTFGPPENCYPAEGLEFEVNSIAIYQDRATFVVGDDGRMKRIDASGPVFVATGKLFQSLCNALDEDIYGDAVQQGDEPGYDDEYEYEYDPIELEDV